MMYMKLDSVKNWMADVLGFTVFPDFIVNLQESENLGFEVVSVDQIQLAIGVPAMRDLQSDIVSYFSLPPVQTPISKVEDHIDLLFSQSFEGWTDNGIAGYKTSIKEFIKNER